MKSIQQNLLVQRQKCYEFFLGRIHHSFQISRPSLDSWKQADGKPGMAVIFQSLKASVSERCAKRRGPQIAEREFEVRIPACTALYLPGCIISAWKNEYRHCSSIPNAVVSLAQEGTQSKAFQYALQGRHASNVSAHGRYHSGLHSS